MTTVGHLPYSVEFQHRWDGDGTVTVTSGGYGNPSWVENCTRNGHSFSCEWSATSIEFGFEGGDPARLTADHEPLERTSGPESYCGSALETTGIFTITKPGNPAEQPELPGTRARHRRRAAHRQGGQRRSGRHRRP
jgi:hypothetical protein